MHCYFNCIYYNFILYNKIKIGYGYIWGAGSVSNVAKVPDKIADFVPYLGGCSLRPIGTLKNCLKIKKYTFLYIFKSIPLKVYFSVISVQRPLILQCFR